MADDVHSGRSEHVVVGIGESLRRRNDDGVSRVDTKGIEVLHVTDCDTVISAVSDDFIFDLLPALHTALNEDLGAGSESLVAEVEQLRFIVCETTSEPTKSVGSSDNDREANVLDNTHSLFYVVGRRRLGTLFANRLHAPGKELSILCSDDSINGSTENLDAKALEFILELDTNLEGGLTTEGYVDTVRSLLLDDLADEVCVDRQEVNLVGKALGSLDGSDVGIDQNGVDSLFLQSLDRLTARVIELSSLSNAQTSTAQNEHLLDVDPGSELPVLFKGATREFNRLGQDFR